MRELQITKKTTLSRMITDCQTTRWNGNFAVDVIAEYAEQIGRGDRESMSEAGDDGTVDRFQRNQDIEDGDEGEEFDDEKQSGAVHARQGTPCTIAPPWNGPTITKSSSSGRARPDALPRSTFPPPTSSLSFSKACSRAGSSRSPP